MIRSVVVVAALGLVVFASSSAAQPGNPHAYCAARKNDPGPGEQSAEELPRVVRAAGATYWRCAAGLVMVCSGGASGSACAKTEAVDARRMTAFREFCREFPNEDYIPNSLTVGLASEWRCKGTAPMMTATKRVDAQGYFVGNWRPLPTPVATAARTSPQVTPRGGNALAQMSTTRSEIRLTPIEPSWGGSNCSLYLSYRNGELVYESIVGGWEYGEGPWSVGVNGRVYKLPQVDLRGSDVVLASSVKGAPRIVIRRQNTIKSAKDSIYPKNIDQVLVMVTLNAKSSVIPAYRFCGEG